MNKITLSIIILLVFVIACLSIAISAIRHENKILKMEINRLEAVSALSEQSLLQSNEVIERQNSLIKELKISSESSAKTLQLKLSETKLKYDKLKKEADSRLSDNNSCDTKLSIILEQQSLFLGGS